MGTGEFHPGGNPAMDWHPIQGGVEIFLVASCHGNRDKLRPDEPLGSYADFTLPKHDYVKGRFQLDRVSLKMAEFLLGIEFVENNGKKKEKGASLAYV